MKFYEVESIEGPQLVSTQADVKALRQPVRAHEVPTDKDGLMAYINDLMKRPPAPVQEQTEEVAAKPVVAAPVQEQVEAELTPEAVEDFILASKGSELRMVFETLISAMTRRMREVEEANGSA